METIRLEPVDSLTVTTLVDNMTDLLLVDQGPAKRPPMTMAVDPSVPAGFHLNGPLFEKIIEPTCDALAAFSPDWLVPTHCTGWHAMQALAAGLPEAFIQNSVGTCLELAAA